MGDVIYIEANSGSVKRVGRCDAYATEFDLEARLSPAAAPHAVAVQLTRSAAQAEEYVPLPKGDVHKKKEIVQASNHAQCCRHRTHSAARLRF